MSQNSTKLFVVGAIKIVIDFYETRGKFLCCVSYCLAKMIKCQNFEEINCIEEISVPFSVALEVLAINLISIIQ